LEGGAQIDKIEPADAQLLSQEGRYSLATNHVGRSKITIHFASPISTEAGGRSFAIPFAPAAIKTLSLSGLPEGEIAQVTGATLSGSGKASANYRLPKESEVQVRIVPQPEPPELPTPSHWKIESQSLVRFGEGKLQYQTHVSAFAADGSGLDLELVLPASARISNVTGDDMLNWTVGKKLRIDWKTRNLLSREFDLVYEIPQPATAGVWKLQTPHLTQGEPGEGLFAVTGERGMEMRATAPQPTRLPRWLAQCASKLSVVLVGSDGGLEVKWLPLVPTSPAVIDSARSVMHVVSDGAMVDEITYCIRHEGPLNWQLHLPTGTQLLTCLVNGNAINPVDRGENVIELALDAPGRQGTEVKVSTMARKSPFKPVTGQIELELPMTELLIQKLDWELQIPANYELAAIEGNVESLPSSRPTQILLRKELCKNEYPVIRLFYQKPETRK